MIMKKTTSILLILISLIFAAGCKTKAVESQDITLIYIDEKTINHFGTYPWTRDKYALFIDAIYKKYNPKVVYFDIIIDLPSKETPQLDKKLFKSVKGKNNLVFCTALSDKEINNRHYKAFHIPKKQVVHTPVFSSNGGLFPLKEIVDNGGIVSISSLPPGVKGQYNNFPAVYDIKGHMYVSTPIMLYSLYKNISVKNLKFSLNQMYANSQKMPLNETGFIKINFNYSFKKFSYVSVIKGDVDSSLINNKIIIVGKNAIGLSVKFPTKVSLQFNGSELVACATQTLLYALKKK